MDIFLQFLKYILFAIGVVTVAWHLFNNIKLFIDFKLIKDEALPVIIFISLGTLILLVANLIFFLMNGITGLFLLYAIIGSISLLSIFVPFVGSFVRKN